MKRFSIAALILVGLFACLVIFLHPQGETAVQETTQQALANDPSQDPYAKGNVPLGGGPNEDAGPGPYLPLECVVQPPSTPRVDPAPPESPSPFAWFIEPISSFISDFFGSEEEPECFGASSH